jgi:hypothetical protein
MSFLLKNKIVAVFAAMMLVEAVVLFVVLGGSSGPGAKAAESASSDAKDVGEFAEFELGEFKISNNMVESAPMRIDCKIFVEVAKEYEAEFRKAYEGKQHRVRDAIQGVVRGASYADVTDPDLGAVKRKIKKAVSDVVGSEKPYISQVIVSDFQSYQL